MRYDLDIEYVVRWEQNNSEVEDEILEFEQRFMNPSKAENFRQTLMDNPFIENIRIDEIG